MKGRMTFWLCALIGCGAHANVERAVVETRREVQQEQMALVREREAVGAQRRDLAAEVRAREARVAELREDVARRRRVQRQSAEAAQRQRRELEAARQLERDLQALSREARRALAAQLPAAAAAAFADRFAELDPMLRREGVDASLEAAQALLTLFEAVNARAQSPWRTPATVAGADGIELEGTVLFVGPLHWFYAETEGIGGLLMDRHDEALPRLWPIPGDAVPNLMRQGSATVPADLTGGRALLYGAEARSWVARLGDGGLTMIPLALTALASLVLVFWKTLALTRVRGRDPERVAQVARGLRTGADEAELAASVAAAPEPLRTLLEGALAHPRANAEELEELLHERMLGLIPRLDRHLGTLAVLGGVAPLLGLLGTVTGMIHTFELVTIFGSGNERILSQGISEALVTTMSGLIIAVPVLLAHAFLSRRVRVIISELEQSIAGLIQARHRHAEVAG